MIPSVQSCSCDHVYLMVVVVFVTGAEEYQEASRRKQSATINTGRDSEGGAGQATEVRRTERDGPGQTTEVRNTERDDPGQTTEVWSTQRGV